jgi:hypothetical protein
MCSSSCDVDESWLHGDEPFSLRRGAPAMHCRSSLHRSVRYITE